MRAPVQAHISEAFVSIQGEGLLAGLPQLFIRFEGCNLACAYCDTKDKLPLSRTALVEKAPGSGRFRRAKNPFTPEGLLSELDHLLDRRTGIHSVSLTGGEPLMHAAFLAGFLPLLRRAGVPVMLETNGTLAAEMRTIRRLVDYVAMDIKLPSVAGGGPQWAAHKEFMKAGKGKGFFIKAVVGPGTSAGEVGRAARMAGTASKDTPFFIQPATGMRHSVLALMKLHAEASRHLSGVKVLPQMHAALGIR